MLAGRDAYHTSVIFTSANSVSGGLYQTSSNITGYFNLKNINERLQKSNAQLENENLNLRNEIAALKAALSDTSDINVPKRFDYILASVINNSSDRPRNYFTINRGRLDGVMPGMGVVDQSGIVGIVNVAGPHTARIISVINETQKFSAKIKDTPFVGTLTWKGQDPSIAYLEDVPRHATFHIGDTIVTSGYSTAFPAGLSVGTIVGRIRASDDNFYVLKVNLASDFKALSTVRIIKDIYKNELDSLVQYDIKTE